MNPATWVVLAVCYGYQLTDEPRKWSDFKVAIAPDGRRVGWRQLRGKYQIFMNGVPTMVHPLECRR